MADEKMNKKASADAADNKKSTAKDKNDKKNKDKSHKKGKTQNKKEGGKLNFKYLGGLLFAKMMKGGASELRANADEVNKLNVFPVPDGDTGDNMSMTIDSGVKALESVNTDDLGAVLKAASKGMLLGARGNSGVILSQFFAGVATGFENEKRADAYAVGRALTAGVEQAYASVMTPTEGTILTVAREAVEYATNRLTPKSTIHTLFSDLVNEMHASVERTPEILKVLRDAGVVDSGAAGLFYIMDGINRVLNGEEIVTTAEIRPSVAVSAKESGFGPDSEMIYGYCTELLLQLQNKKCDIDAFDVEELKAFLATLGDSIVAFKTDSVVKLHVHTLTPEKVLEYARKYGEFITVKIENMTLEHSELKGEDTEKDAPRVKKKYGIVSVSIGDGIESLFRELGADEIIKGGQTNNPSTCDFLDAFDKIYAEHIYVFPNNSNIIMAANQAANIYNEAVVHVIPSKTIGQGYVALSSMNLDGDDPDALTEEATSAIASTVSARVSLSIRDADMNGIHVNNGDTIGILEKDIVVSEPDRISATKALIDKVLGGGDRFMLTVFMGIDTEAEERELIENYVRDSFPLVECYFIDGGQDIYSYIMVAE